MTPIDGPDRDDPGQRFTVSRAEPTLDVDLSRELLESKAAEYEAEEALYAVEDEQLDGLPGAFASGNYGRRDAEWVVRWHFRRYLGEYPDRERRAGEEAFGGNDFELVRDAIAVAVEASDTAEAVTALTELAGVDVPVATAFLQFIDPERYVVLGEREWSVLEAAGELAGPYPDPPTIAAYETYLDACRSLADRFGRDLVTVHRALWRLAKEE